MRASVNKFLPPPPFGPCSAELRWVLQRGLGPARVRPFAEKLDPTRALCLAEDLALAARIRQRTPLSVLAEDLGEKNARDFAEQQVAETFRQMRFDALARRLARLAADLGTPVVFMKGMALRLLDLVNAGERPVVDIDVLVCESDASRLLDQLLRRGFEPKDGQPQLLHHLPSVIHPTWGMIEVHTRMLNIKSTSERTWASVGDLFARDLVEPLADLSPQAWAPRQDVLLAHLFAHTLLQHVGSREHFFRFVGDLQTITCRAVGNGGLADAAHRWIAWTACRAQIEGLLQLAEVLRTDTGLETAMADPSPTGTVFRHFVGLADSPNYADKVAALRPSLSINLLDLEHSGMKKLHLWRSWAEVERGCGSRLTWPAYLWWHAARPMRLLRAAARPLAMSLRRRPS